MASDMVECPEGVILGTIVTSGSTSSGKVAEVYTPIGGDWPWQGLILWLPAWLCLQNLCPGGQIELLCEWRLMHHRCEPCSPCGPCKMVLPSWSLMVTLNCMKIAVFSASQRVPMLRRLFMKDSMTWLRWDCPAGSIRRSMVVAVVVDECWC